MRTRVAGATAVQAAVRASMTRPATITLCYGLGGPKVDRSIAGLRAPGDRDGRINVAARHWRGQDTRLPTCAVLHRRLPTCGYFACTSSTSALPPPVAQVSNLCRPAPQVANLRLRGCTSSTSALPPPRSTGCQPVPFCTAGCQPAATWLHLVHVCLTAPRSTAAVLVVKGCMVLIMLPKKTFPGGKKVTE